MVLQNFWRVPAAWFKLCHYAKNTEKYPEMTKWQHIQYILKLAVTSGNVNFECYGVENLPKEDGFLMYGNHQGLTGFCNLNKVGSVNEGVHCACIKPCESSAHNFNIKVICFKVHTVEVSYFELTAVRGLYLFCHIYNPIVVEIKTGDTVI